jgi:hypothetical protein
MYFITLYGKDDLEVFTHTHDTKAEQMKEYYELLANGYKKSQIEKGKYMY